MPEAALFFSGAVPGTAFFNIIPEKSTQENSRI
jgi:hypothetical protein